MRTLASSSWIVIAIAAVLSVGCTALNDFGRFTFESDAGTDGGPMCEGGLTACSGACVDTTSDGANCGGCGVACGTGELCMASACMPACDSGLALCGGECVDTTTDTAHCGGCDTQCTSSEQCIAGDCLPICTGTEVRCGTVCADTETDEAHCGGCDMACGAGRTCLAGVCLPETHEWRFTSCGQSGRFGPTEAQCAAEYAGTSLDGAVTVPGPAGFQQWTVPEAGQYRIEARGAQGWAGDARFRGGAGAAIAGTFALSAGDVLTVLVGQMGEPSSDLCSGGGGGGSFVSRGPELLVVAGGGGGTRTDVEQDGCAGRVSAEGGTASGDQTTHTCDPRTDGVRAGGIASSDSWGSAGGGADSAGGADGSYGTGGDALVSSATGGIGDPSSCGALRMSEGGFGGGGSGNGCCGGGGGGGYSGGDGGRVAGGGGSFNGGAAPNDRAGANYGHGSVTIWRCTDDGECFRMCPAPAVMCGDDCADTSSDAHHCGGCADMGGTVCASGEGCVSGACAPVDCGPPDPPANGDVVLTSSAYGGVATYQCNWGYELPGPRTRTCEASGAWSEPVPTCVPWSETVAFPVDSDPRSTSVPWVLGQWIEGTRTTMLPAIRSASATFNISNALTCDNQDMRLMINGIEVGRFSVTPGATVVTPTFSFGDIGGPTYTLRLENVRTVASACGSAGFDTGSVLLSY